MLFENDLANLVLENYHGAQVEVCIQIATTGGGPESEFVNLYLATTTVSLVFSKLEH